MKKRAQQQQASESGAATTTVNDFMAAEEPVPMLLPMRNADTLQLQQHHLQYEHGSGPNMRTYVVQVYIEIVNCFIFFFLTFTTRAAVEILSDVLITASNALLATLLVAFSSACVSYTTVRIGDIVESGLANPTWTIAKFILGKYRGQRRTLNFPLFAVFIGVQFVTSVACAAIVYSFFSGLATPDFKFGLVRVNPLSVVSEIPVATVFASEMLGSGILAFAAVVYVISHERLFPQKHATYHNDAHVISAIAFLVTSTGFVFTSGCFNPFVHLAMLIVLSIAGVNNLPLSQSWVYYIAPILSSTFVAILYYIVFRIWNLESALSVSKMLKLFISSKAEEWFLDANAREMKKMFLSDAQLSVNVANERAAEIQQSDIERLDASPKNNSSAISQQQQQQQQSVTSVSKARYIRK